MIHRPQHGTLASRKGSLNGGLLQGPFSSIATLAICLLVSQLVIFNIGVILYRGKTNGNESNIPSNEYNKPALYIKSVHYSEEDPIGVGAFNGYPVYFKQHQIDVETSSHCVGENYQEKTSWQKKSCHFNDLFCFDTKTKDYVVFENSEREKMYKHVESRPFTDVSQSYMKMNELSLGGINLKWSEDVSRLKWFPEIRTVKKDESLSYYELPPNVVMIPFHSLNGGNPGHLVWDDFLPVYTLLRMFQLNNESTELMLMRYVLKGQGDGGDSRGLWASCDWNDAMKESCRKMYKKFLPLMLGLNPIHDEVVTTENFDFQLNKGNADNNESTLICAKQGLAGIGPLTDHGTMKLHGWEEKDYQSTQNHGRGGMLYEFRNYMLKNMNIPTELTQQPPFRIIFSEKSSRIAHRNFDFSKQKQLLEQSFHPSYVSVESYVFSEMSLVEQLEIASQASIFITSCGGGAVSSIFMPKGSSVIMYYLEDGGVVGNQRTFKPARLDWDLFNNLAYLKVHWLPAGTMETDNDIKSLFSLIEHELEGLLRERSYDHFFN